MSSTLTTTAFRAVIDLTQDSATPPVTRPGSVSHSAFPYGNIPAAAWRPTVSSLPGAAVPPTVTAPREEQQHPAKRRCVEGPGAGARAPSAEVVPKTLGECMRQHLLPAVNNELTKLPKARYLRQQIAELVSCQVFPCVWHVTHTVQARPFIVFVYSLGL
jgi:hypothetical protein